MTHPVRSERSYAGDMVVPTVPTPNYSGWSPLAPTYLHPFGPRGPV